jgi:dolichol-phosphate mannosyltransferase
MLSIIFLSYFSGERITIAYHKLLKLLNEKKIPFEFIIMDDASTDASY